MYDEDEDLAALKPLPEDYPVLEPMRGKREVDIAVNKKGHIWIVYDQPFEEKVSWLEYDHDDATLTLVLKNGKYKDLGKTVPQIMRKSMKKAKVAMMAQMDMETRKPVEMFPVTVIVRDTGF